MLKLVGGLQNYAWGSHTLLADLRGDQPSTEPEAELWYGAHPGTATMCGDGRSLLECIEANPVELLGPSIVARFGPKLPFLLKLLAAGSPLSIQAHPSIEQAQAGFAAEEAAGVARTDPTRSFKDDNHKPELICALTPFEALVGFRRMDATRNFFAEIDFHALDGALSEGPKAAVEALLAEGHGGEVGEVAGLVEMLVAKCAGYGGEAWVDETALIARCLLYTSPSPRDRQKTRMPSSA